MKKPAALHWLLLVLSCIYAVALFNHPLVPSMEPRFAEAVREMLARHEYLVPIKNGIPYIEYPPLYFWLGLLGAALGLPIEAAIRLPGYIALLLWVVWLARLQKELFPAWPKWLLPLTGAALPGVLYNFYMAQSDSLLILGTLIAFTGYIRIRTDRPLRAFPWELWLGVALATAAKGPVGIAVTLPAMGLEIVATGYLSMQPDTGEPRGFRYRTGWVWQEILRMSPGRGIPLALIGIVPWYIAAGFSINWDFVRAVLVYQNFTRFFVGFDHLQPWWLYFQTVWGDFMPLCLLLPFGLYYGFRYVRREFRWRLLLIWTLWTVLFFTLSASKQSKYILTAAPAMALLALAAIEPVFKTDKLHGIVRGLLGGISVIILGIFAFLLLGTPKLTFIPKINHLWEMPRNLALIDAAVKKAPGKIVSFQWPRSLTLYHLGGPMPYVRSSREFYTEIHGGEIKPGDYILVDANDIPLGSEQDPQKLVPAPDPKYFEQVMRVEIEDPLILFRVKPAAATMPMPATPQPIPLQWWQQFDTD
ncbi:MAG TPA: hypothetical protein VKT74_09175 [Gammaproteobacteria bacterium]|nr:hypothetical protein [Gammaproteobacteria bacterium]